MIIHSIGIPRALYYYQLFPFWETFLRNLGLRVVVSPPTNRYIMDRGVERAVDGTCLPVKVYLGHVFALINQGVETIFVPRLISVARKEYICPNFLGLPDLVEKQVPRSIKIVSPDIDGQRSDGEVARSYLALGRQFAPLPVVVSAYRRAIRAQKLWENGFLQDIEQTKRQLTIAVLGHPYLLHDPFVSHGVIEKLKALGVQVVTPQHLSDKVLSQRAKSSLAKRMFWTSGRKNIGAFEHYLHQVDGVVSLAAFSCGVDSLIGDAIERRSQHERMPHLLLYLDEHTGEAGLITRLEAFLDMLTRRKRA